MIDRRKVYRYRWAGEPKYTGLAMDCHIHDGQNGPELRYFDTIRGHMVQGEIAQETEDGFTFRSDGYAPGEWTFQELTIQDFRRWVYKHIGMGEAIAQKITTTADLHEWFRKTFGLPEGV